MPRNQHGTPGVVQDGVGCRPYRSPDEPLALAPDNDERGTAGGIEKGTGNGRVLHQFFLHSCPLGHGPSVTCRTLQSLRGNLPCADGRYTALSHAEVHSEDMDDLQVCPRCSNQFARIAESRWRPR